MHRRGFLRAGLGAAGALGLAGATAGIRPEWSRAPGAPMSGYGARSPFEDHVQRLAIASQPGTAGSGVSRTPLEHLDGVITPNGLFFERHHSGVPAIDPEHHRLKLHGLVRQPLAFTMEDLDRYPRVTRTCFLECSGNSRALAEAREPQQTCGALNGLISTSEFTGVPLSILLDEAGLLPEAAWVVAEGDDAARMSRSVPLSKTLDDALVVLFQNGERLRPENGYPLRLLLPGFEGNMSIKWLHRLHVVAEPAMTREETSKYSDLRPDGSAELFTFVMGVKSVITSPSPGLSLRNPGLYQISGLGWSGGGAIRRVEVSADGGRSWADAHLDGPVEAKRPVRFRAAWRWDGGPAVLQSRAHDDAGAVQPPRCDWLAAHGAHADYHYNAVQSWAVNADGSVRTIHA